MCISYFMIKNPKGGTMSDIFGDNSINGSVKSSLVSKNIKVKGRRTSVRLEPEMWTAFKNIAKRESCTMHDLCTLIHMRKDESSSLTAAIRVFLMLYFRAAATEVGHIKAGHGNFNKMQRRAGVDEDMQANDVSNETPKEIISNRLSPHLTKQSGDSSQNQSA